MNTGNSQDPNNKTIQNLLEAVTMYEKQFGIDPNAEEVLNPVMIKNKSKQTSTEMLT